ncbi:MAG: tetratricopeptide repeat protein [Bacteroidetes bacterium]|nr:tetratricopeptide repeat protein [Bacteroidota bacterium]
MKKIIFGITLLFSVSGAAQNNDSLLHIWNDHGRPDTVRLKANHALARSYVNTDPDTAIILLKRELDLATSIHNQKFESIALSTMGMAYYFKGNFDTSFIIYKRSVALDSAQHDKRGMASGINNIGNIFKMKGDYPSAIFYYQESMRIKDELKDVKGIATTLNNIGLIYKEQGDYDDALKNFEQSLHIQDSVKNKRGMANSLSNIGGIYQLEKKFSEALSYYEKCKLIEEELGDEESLAGTYNNIGGIYKDLGDPDNAEKNYRESLQLAEKTNSTIDLARIYSSLGILYNSRNDFINGKTFCMKAYDLAMEIGDPEVERDDCNCLSESFSGLHDYKSSLNYFIKYQDYKDSLVNDAHTKEITKTTLRYEFEKKAEADSILQADQIKLTDAQLQAKDARLQKEKYLRVSLILGISGLAFLIIFVFRRLRESEKQKKIIAKQKLLVEEKQTEILDSIIYAKKIQKALLKPEEHVSLHLPPHFIFFKPRNIVSGDFFWALEKEDYLYFCAADCTGHGVPGALLTMLGTAFLNEINATSRLLSPAEILEELRKKFISELDQHEHGSNYDGMDISLLRLNLRTKELTWSGANNPLYYIRGGELIEIKATKQPIGFMYEMTPFKDHCLHLEKDDIIYLFTDGFADQFGGEQGKKFRYSRLKETLLSLRNEPMSRQKILLKDILEKWKGNYEQVDDICLIGMKV